MDTGPPDVSRQVSDQPDVDVEVEGEDDDDKETGCCLWLPSSNILPSSLTATPVYDEYSNKALAMNIVSTALILFDYGSDISVAFWLRKEKDSDFFMACTILLIVLPLIVVNLFSLVWYSQVTTDTSATTTTPSTGPSCTPIRLCSSQKSLDHLAQEASSPCPPHRAGTSGKNPLNRL